MRLITRSHPFSKADRCQSWTITQNHLIDSLRLHTNIKSSQIRGFQQNSCNNHCAASATAPAVHTTVSTARETMGTWAATRRRSAIPCVQYAEGDHWLTYQTSSTRNLRAVEKIENKIIDNIISNKIILKNQNYRNHENSRCPKIYKKSQHPLIIYITIQND